MNYKIAKCVMLFIILIFWTIFLSTNEQKITLISLSSSSSPLKTKLEIIASPPISTKPSKSIEKALTGI